MKRHIGKLKNTDQRCVVVFMQIPGRADHALVVSTDNLPPRLEQAVMDVVESAEGQNDPVLGRVLGRRIFGETGTDVMQTLHMAGLLRPVPIDQVIMMPRPNMPFPLRTIIEQMGNASELPPPPVEDPAKFNPHTNNVNARSAEDRQAIARNLLIEADMLQGEADRKRAQAFEHAPELKPAAKPLNTEMLTIMEDSFLAAAPTEKVVKKKVTRKKATS